MNLKRLASALCAATVSLAGGNALGETKTYDWENGATILGMFPAGSVTASSSTEQALSPARSLKVVKTDADTAQAWVAYISGLEDGDEVTAGFWVYDTTPDADPSGRIWANYTRGGIDGYAGSAGGNATYSAGTGWSYLSYTWIFDVGDLTTFEPRTGMVIQCRAYGEPGDAIWVDDLDVTAPDHARIAVPGEPFAFGRMTTTQVDTTVEIDDLCYTTHFSLDAVVITSLPSNGTLLDNGASFDVPHDVSGTLTYEPAAGWSGLDMFTFHVRDAEGQTSADETQEIAVQENAVVITELMVQPDSFQSTYEFIEIYNNSGSSVTLTTLDTDVADDTDTFGNMMDAVIPANSARIIGIDNTAQFPESRDEFLCEWGIDAADVLWVDVDRWEFLFAISAAACADVDGSRALLFGRIGGGDEVLLDAVDLRQPGTLAGGCSRAASYAISEVELGAYYGSAVPDTANNDDNRIWLCSTDITQGRRTGGQTGDQASPVYVPRLFTPAGGYYDPCTGACCLPNGDCLEQTVSSVCDLQCGTFDEDTPCISANCPEGQPHKCCLWNGGCLDLYSACECEDLYDGNWDDATTCAADPICFVPAPAVINELDYQNPSVDDREFIEIYGTPGMDMTGWTIELFDGDEAGVNLYNTFDLSGATIPTDGYFVIGSPIVPNVDLPILDINAIQNGDPDGLVLLDPTGRVMEQIAYGGSFVGRGGRTGYLPLTDIEAVDRADGGLQKIPDASTAGLTWEETTGQTPGVMNDFTGACCDDGECAATTEAECVASGRTYLGDGVECGIPNPCLPLGSCCLPDGSCVADTQEYLCDAMNGVFNEGGICIAGAELEFLPAFTNCLDGPGEPVAGGCDEWDFNGDGHVDLADYRCYQGGGCVATLDQTPGEILVNEIWADDPGTDNHEFFELYGPAGADLSAYTLLVVDGDTAGDLETFTVRSANLIIDLNGYGLDGTTGYFLIGFGPTLAGIIDVDLDAVFGNNNGEADEIQNGSQTYVLTPTAAIEYCTDVGVPEAGCLGNDNELTPSSVVAIEAAALDSVATLDTDFGDITYFGAPLVQDDGFAFDYAQRIPNAQDTNRPIDWETVFGNELGAPADPSTPRAANVSVETIPGACCSGFVCDVTTRAACEASGGEFRGPGTDCDPNPCNCTTIKEAKDLGAGATVCVGDVIVSSTEDFIFSAGVKDLYVQDTVGTNGIKLFGSDEVIDGLGLQVGDVVNLVGTLELYREVWELEEPFTVTPISSGDAPVPFETEPVVYQAQSARGDDLVSTLVVLRGVTFVDAGGTFAGGRAYDVSADGGATTVVVYTATQQLTGLPIPEGPQDIVGIFTWYSGGGYYELEPRTIDDITPSE